MHSSLLTMNDFRQNTDENVLYVTNRITDTDTCLPLLHFNLFKDFDFICHCFTTRLGGVSKDHLSSLNLSYSRGDLKENVTENFRRVAAAMDSSIDDFVFTDQTHTTNIMRVYEEHRGCGITKPVAEKDVDGLITNVPGIILSTFYADCVPLYFIDPVKKAIGLSHSGWRGTVNKMGKKTIRAMSSEFGSDPGDIYAAVGPCICGDCYEVGIDVAEHFIDSMPDYANNILTKKENGKFMLNLPLANKYILLKSGIKEEHLAVSNICTACNENLLFSHRKTGGKRGNLGAFLEILHK